MGQLTALKQPTTTIKTSGGDLTVRGLAFEDIWTLAVDHGPHATLLFNKVINQERFDMAETRVIFQDLIPQMPSIVAATIALAVDEYTPEGMDVAKKLSPRVQLDAIEAILKLTIESEAELKKLVESVIRMLSGATGLITQMRLPLSEAGFGEFGNA
jgi:hypothetical protein